MKQLFSLPAAIIILTAFHFKASAQSSISIPYTPSYSTNFEFGNYKYAQIVFDLWKHYDDNDFSADENIFADTLSMDFSNGKTVRGKKELNDAVKKFRTSVKTAKENVTTYVVLKPKEADETWVCIWGSEVDTYQNGKTATTWMNENWKFNKDGKVAYISQYNANETLATNNKK